MKLREYQEESKKLIKSAWSEGDRRTMLVKPTGSGKTVTFASICFDIIKKKKTAMIVVDRKELLEQAVKKLMAFGIIAQPITGGKRFRNSDIYVATVQTLLRREIFPNVNVIIIDEAHKQCFDKLHDQDNYKDTFFVGCTATPHRFGKMRQLSDMYQRMIEPVTIEELINNEYLVPAVTYGSKIDMDAIKTKKVDGLPDYDSSASFNMFDRSSMYAGVVEKYRKFANHTKAICFNINREHSIKQTQEFLSSGISARHIDGSTPKSERAKAVKDFSEGHFDILCNCDLYTTGFDDWSIETVIVNRPTKSLPLWLQMGGRGSRVTPDEFKGIRGYTQKDHFNIIDMGGNTFRLGFWEQPRDWSLTHKTKPSEGVSPVKVCPEDTSDKNNLMGCGALLHASASICNYCGFVFEKKDREFIDAEFVELVDQNPLPDHLKGMSLLEMDDEELEEYRVAKKYKVHWGVRQMISRHGKDGINKYAAMRGFKNGWIKHAITVHESMIKEYEEAKSDL